ncbi:MAG: DUF115 domain-containing protein [Candidatus Rhabdochlamydia sp.]
MLDKYGALELELSVASFSSTYKPLAQEKKEEGVKRLLQGLSSTDCDVIYLYRMSGGYPFKVLEPWLSASVKRHLIFLEDDLEQIHQAFICPWKEDLFSHPRVHLYRLGHHDEELFEALAHRFPCENIKMLSMEKTTAKMRKIELTLMRKTVLWHSVLSEVASGPLLHKNIFSNMRRLNQSFSVNTTHQAFAGRVAIICGAGPSLEIVADELKALQDQVLIIGCGSALSALAHLGIKPHLGIAADPNPRERQAVEGCQFRDIPLIYGTRLYPTVFELFNPPYGYIKSPSASALERWIEEDLGITQEDIGTNLGKEALSVTTLAVSLACFWGCSSIALAGVDLAYEQGRHYSPGVPLSQEVTSSSFVADKRLRRKSVYGHSVITQLKWVMEQETLSRYTRSYPHISFTHAARKGLGFPLIPYQSLSSLQQHGFIEPISDKVKEMITNNWLLIEEEKILGILGQISEGFKRCLQLITCLQKEKEGSGKAVLYEQELVDEKVYALVLEPALVAAQKMSFLEEGSELGERKWKILHEIVQEYLISLKTQTESSFIE